MNKLIFLPVLVTLFIAGCMQAPDTREFKPSTQKLKYTQSNFYKYIQENREWLRNNRNFITNDKGKELDANAPFELKPQKILQKKKGVLLVHGLADSPFSFVDIARSLSEQGMLVRVVLLPGHGSKVGDLIQLEMNDWEKVVSHHTKLLKSEVDEVWLGGFSTGGNLVTSLALQDESIKGILLFSPAFKPRSSLVSLAPFLSNFLDWADIDPNDNFVRYDSLTFKAAGEYYKTSRKVRDELEVKAFDRPVLISISEDDSVVDTLAVLRLFENRFTHSRSKLIWYGNPPESSDNRILVMNSRLPELRVSNFSHMASLFSSTNTHYGNNGEYRMCNNGQGSDREAICLDEENVWYSAYGYTEESKVHARLTWNPHFQHLTSALESLINQ